MTPHRSVFYLAQMCCSSEERLVRKNLSALPGVREMTFNLMEKRVTISHSYDSETPLLDSLRRLGMEPSLQQTVAPPGPAPPLPGWPCFPSLWAAWIRCEGAGWPCAR